MLTLYDFKCTDCERIAERLIPSEDRGKTVDCVVCGGTSVRLISPIRSILEGHSGHFPTAADKWAKRHESAGRKPSETDPRGW